MKYLSRFLLLLTVTVLFMLPYRAFAFFGAEVAVGEWWQSPSGTIAYKPVTSIDDIDLKNDLKYDTKARPYFRAKVELPVVLPNVYLQYTPMSFEGTGSKDVNFHYGGTTFQANVPTQSKVKLDHTDLALYYPIPLLKTATLGKLNAELGLNVRQIKFEGSISQSTAGLSASKDLTIYVPMIYAGVQIKPVSLFSLEAEIRGIAYGSNHYYDYLGRLKVNPIPVVFIAGGYRAEDLKIDASDVKAGIKFSGPFIEAGVSF
ncbi:MAG TPA: TIGR04219 family outer membrane beta-barrel protein [Nitrospirota bacterium]|nr:TIGR04219 family outer membrane beta-barrel protein [Nitrospirota bacterium]